MKFLIRSFIFLSLLCSLAFSKNGDNGYYYVMRDYNLPSAFKPIDGKFLKGNNYYGLRSPEIGYYFIYSFTIRQEAYYFAGSHKPGFYVGFGHVYIGGNSRVGRFGQRGSIGDYERYVVSDYPKDPVFTYYDFIVFNPKEVARCSLNQEFNTDTMQCVDSCPAGQLWNVQTNACVVDCTDEDNHKFFTSDYACIDCSSALTIDDIARCYCAGIGSSYNPGYAWDPNKPNIVNAHCKNETLITFKFDKSKENSNKDKDKEKEDPNKDKDKENPNKDKDKEDPSKDKDKDNTTPGGGGSSGSGSTDSGGGTVSPGGDSGKDNGKDKGDGKDDGKDKGGGHGGGGGGNNDSNTAAGNLDYDDLKKSELDTLSKYSNNVEDNFSFVKDIKQSLSDSISKIKNGNLMKLNRGNIPNTCPLSFDIDMIFFKKKIAFDFCSFLSPIASSLYVFFFIAFFLLFLFLIAKLFIFTFMGW
ncbi:hypothetical protein [Campylobacter concisus]|uniref:hypothetical protein n=1 Tax=Campylobacter concisus TaxID=199 RepID=UPI001901D3E6|nr:hypothetical protein [Campylobacter concisus]